MDVPAAARRVIGLLAAILVSHAAFAQGTPAVAASGTPPGFTLHRSHAGEKDGAGGYPAASTNGRFAVSLPLTFNDFELEGKPGEDVSHGWAVGGGDGKRLKLLAIRTAHSKGAAAAREKFADMASGELNAHSHAVQVRRFDYHGRPAVDLVFENASTRAYTRTVLLKPDLMLLTVEHPRSMDDRVAPLVEPFMSSLTFQAD